jgi:acyl-CoA reductase-like NAD-dependent aldehyde dehydrogenase
MSCDLENAKFIAGNFPPGNVRDAMTDMVAEIERLRGELAIWNQPGAMVRRINHLRALNAELTEAAEKSMKLLIAAFGEYAFAREHLPPEQRALFEKNFATPARRHIDELGRILAKAQTPTET